MKFQPSALFFRSLAVLGEASFFPNSVLAVDAYGGEQSQFCTRYIVAYCVRVC